MRLRHTLPVVACILALHAVSAPAVAGSAAADSASAEIVDTSAISQSTGGFGPESVVNWSGFIRVADRRHLYYMFFESRNEPETDALIVWLTGGPGCSSLIAFFAENGPYVIAEDLSLSINPYSWNTRANVIWIDSPVGTGFSYSEDGEDGGPLTEREIANDLYEFLDRFLTAYPKYRSLDLILSGESFAGHFLPPFATRILEGNAKAKETGAPSRINLVAVAIGNGLVDPLVQYESYPQYAFDNGMVTRDQYDVMQATLPGCLDLIRRCSQESTSGWHACLKSHVLCAYSIMMPIAASNINPYDVRRPCGPYPLCYDLSRLDRFLAQPEVQSSLGVRSHWRACDRSVNEHLALAGDWMINYDTHIPQLLEHGVRVVVYAGEKDFICNWYGNQAWVDRLKWRGRSSYLHASNTTWVVDGVDAGSSRTFGGLTFVRVRNAGHMVPMDQPQHALDLIERVLMDQPFDEQPLRTDHARHHHQKRHQRADDRDGA